MFKPHFPVGALLTSLYLAGPSQFLYLCWVGKGWEILTLLLLYLWAASPGGGSV